MGKKAKKGKKGGKDEAPPEEPSEFDEMPEEDLRKAIEELDKQLEKARADRNYVQVERDTIQTFYDISRKEVQQCELDIMTKEKEMEQLEENHRVEVRVYAQKVKHLEYEHKNNMKQSAAEGDAQEEEERLGHEGRVDGLKDGKKSLKMELLEVQLENGETVRQMQDTHKKNLSKLDETFEENLETLRKKYEDNLEDLRQELELRRKVEIHEIEERKNSHINDLMKNHDKAFHQIKTYYNDITHDNLKLIRSLKEEVSEMRKKATANQKLMYEIAQENKRLSEPLAVAVKEVAELRHKLKDFEKDKTSLKYATARLKRLKQDLTQQSAQHKDLETRFRSTEFERDKIYDTFEETISDVQRKAEFKNVLLEQRLGQMRHTQEERLQQIRALCANVDPVTLQRVTQELDRVIDERDSSIESMENYLALVQKTHNDTVRTLTEKLREFGIPEEDATLAKLLSTQTSTVPAGLLA
ncbi:Growth arrest-specific protein 8-like [Hondaea fermentalgiana]|uniref:Growth arrest-specific protein 8-like n=1 Tax=Hondaea fermentalgiana TaxID=2315210 RepID=A0A2R5GL82_9STRA|nr:Growth arrest-specific protein 8-like [Hondaea fermentalgiana]|eukprot:GBG31059.1 Growth arrest-specific protein 8-like [Hondaea fermentalgiana]